MQRVGELRWLRPTYGVVSIAGRHASCSTVCLKRQASGGRTGAANRADRQPPDAVPVLTSLGRWPERTVSRPCIGVPGSASGTGSRHGGPVAVLVTPETRRTRSSPARTPPAGPSESRRALSSRALPPHTITHHLSYFVVLLPRMVISPVHSSQSETEDDSFKVCAFKIGVKMHGCRTYFL